MKSTRVLFVLAVALISVFVLWGCPKKAEVTTTQETPKEAAPAPAPPQTEIPTPAPAPEVTREAPAEKAAPAAGLQPIYFDFDKSFIRDDAKPVMKANAEWLKANPKVKIKIEGNCDERGTKEYNQALGQRRAVSAKKYLTDMGIAASRISLISYGKEKPICMQSNEDCWQRNRRDDLVAQ